MGESLIHSSAVIDPGAQIDSSCRVWHFAHVREKAILEKGVSIGKNVYIDRAVKVGEYSRIQNGVSVYQGINIKPWSFIGPHVIFTNDQRPRVGKKNWEVIETNLKTGCSIGAGAIIICGITIGDFAMVAAGSIVTKDVPPFHLVLGAPSEVRSKICACGDTMIDINDNSKDFVRDCCKKNLDENLLKIALEIQKNV